VEILNTLVDDLTTAGVHMPMALPPTEVTPDLSQNAIGLSEADFGRLVTSAYYSLAAIGTFAHQIIMIQANDDAAARDVKNLVSSFGGYDPQKWICVWPEAFCGGGRRRYVQGDCWRDWRCDYFLGA
jgi:hypothetical protein